MALSVQEALTLVIALGGFLGTIALLVLNLRVQGAMALLRLEMANMRTDAAVDRANFYEKVMDTMSRSFVSRDAWDTAHVANTRRLDGMDTKLDRIDQRVSDIA
jgi:hypothetical protein